MLEREDLGALLEALGSDAVGERLTHGDAAHLADPLVVPVAQPPHRLCREAPRLVAVQQNRQDAARINLSLGPLGDVGGAGECCCASRTEMARLAQSFQSTPMLRGAMCMRLGPVLFLRS